MMNWLAIDPGKTVGWATGYRGDEGYIELMGCGELPSHESIRRIGEVIEIFGVQRVAIERPSMKPRTGGDDISREVGRELNNVLIDEYEMPIHWQTASDAKGVITDKRLKDMGFWMPGKPHARDAIRHLIIAIRREK